MGVWFDCLGLEQVLAIAESRAPDAPFDYVVTPNVDHVVKLHRSGADRSAYYNNASLCLNDSRVLARLSRLIGVNLPVSPGSDLTECLFDKVIAQTDPIVIVGCDPDSVRRIEERYGLKHIYHLNPPMGFDRDPVLIDECVAFVRNHPARFVFLAVGAPRQELVAYEIWRRQGATGLGFCIGASLNFLAGIERRAPALVQKAGFEWLFRLLVNPRRLWRRYLVEGPKIFWLFYSEWRTRRRIRGL